MIMNTSSLNVPKTLPFGNNFQNVFVRFRKYSLFTINLKKIICGWHVGDQDYDLANLLIILASFSVYKARIIYNDTQKFTPISNLFHFELKKIDQILSNTKRKPKIYVDPDKWMHCKTFWNIL